jgi:hypothetical protein
MNVGYEKHVNKSINKHSIDLIFLIVNSGERRPLLSGTTSPNPTISSQHSIIIPNERHQSFYSPIHSIDGTS